MKKIICLLVILISIIAIVFITKKDVKSEYEILNNKKDYIKVNIPKDNSFKYINYKELSQKLKLTSVIYIGRNDDQASRDSINQLQKASDETGIDTIYYIDIRQVKKNKLKKVLRNNIYYPSLIISKNGKIKNYIYQKNKKYKKMSKTEKTKLKETYVKAIDSTIICNTEEPDC